MKMMVLLLFCMIVTYIVQVHSYPEINSADRDIIIELEDATADISEFNSISNCCSCNVSSSNICDPTLCMNSNGYCFDCNAQGKITQIQLSDCELIGTIPSSIVNLTALQSLKLDSNSLQGTIPTYLGAINSLTTLVLKSNSFSGTVPTEFQQLTNLLELLLFGVTETLGENDLSCPPNYDYGCIAIESSDYDNYALSCNVPYSDITCPTCSSGDYFLGYSTFTCVPINSGGGHSDPHFYGFHGEKMEIKRDENAANQLFHVYCSPSVSIITLFYEYPDKLLFMTKFWVRLGNTLFTLNLSTKPKMISSNYEQAVFLQELGRYRIRFEDGYMEWDDNMLRVTYKYLKINFSSKVYLNNSPYMNIDISVKGQSIIEQKATGIVGRTLHSSLTDAQFQNYLQFKASLSDIINFSCSSLLD